MKRIALIGDSIRIGYEPIVQELLAGRAEVWGPQGHGGPSAQVLANLETWTLSLRPEVVHINCGLHDMKKPPNPGLGPDRGQPVTLLDQYAANVRAILVALQGALPATRVIWATTTPVHEERHRRNPTWWRYMEDVIEYNRVASGVASSLGVEIHDLYALVMETGRDELLKHDGVHCTPDGCRLLGERVAAKVMEHKGPAG